MKNISIGFLGFGNIGTGVYKIIKQNGQKVLQQEGISLKVKKILVRNISKKREVVVQNSVLTENEKDILENPDIDIVVEFMGGEHPAYEYIKSALQNGKTVVTANKEVIAKHYKELDCLAQKNNTGLYYEASVCGGIPIIKTVQSSLQANNIKKIMGIINGTTNYILTKMSEEKRPFDEVLKEAQELGYAEPDPTSDIEGFDAKYKISILSTLCFNNWMQLDDILCEGITNITLEDVKYANELGYGIKLLAIAKKSDGRIQARVHPTFIPLEHPLYAVRNSFNAVFLQGDAVGDLMLYGRGAGDFPTGSAIVSDIISAAKTSDHLYAGFDKHDLEIEIDKDWESEYFIRLTAKDSPGVLSEVSGIFAEYDVSIASVIQKFRGAKTASIIFVTHLAKEKSLMEAIGRIKSSDSITTIDNIIRVES